MEFYRILVSGSGTSLVDMFCISFILDQCKVLPIFQHIFSECNSFYSWEKEDEGNYHLGWVPENITTNKTIDEERTSKQKNAWQYNTAWELKGTPYWAGFSTYWGGGIYYFILFNIFLLFTIFLCLFFTIFFCISLFF